VSYIDAAKKDGRPTWFVFRGQTDDGVTVTPVAWATRALAEVGQQVEPRLLLESSVGRSLSQDIGGAPSGCSATIGLISSDDALRSFIIGSTSSDPRLEYSEGSILNFSGKLYHAVQDEDGTIYEQAITPTLRLNGAAVYDGAVIRLPMASDFDLLLGRSRYAWTVGEIAKSLPGTDGVDPFTGTDIDGEYAIAGSTGTVAQADADTDLSTWQEGGDAPARFIYGGAQAMLLQRVNSWTGVAGNSLAGIDVVSKAQFFGFLSLLEPDIASSDNWRIGVGQADDSEDVATLGAYRLVKVARWMQDSESDWKLVWLVYVQQTFPLRGVASHRLYQDQELWLTGMPSSQGLASHNPSPPKSEFGTPAYVIRRMVTDHSLAGTSGIDTTTFDAARLATPHADICAGFYEGNTPLREVLTHITSAFGLDIWTGTDDKLRASAAGAFSQAEVAAIQAGGLDEITEADILGEWSEVIPRGANQRGAAVNRVTVEWSDAQLRFWGKSALRRAWRAAARVPYGQIIEASISGAYLNPSPSRSALALARYAGLRAYPGRRIRFRTRLWVAARELRTLMYLSHRRGLESAAGGYVRRLIRLEGVEVEANLRNCVATFEDLGPLAGLKFALLDDYANWIKTTPAGGTTLTLSAGSVNVVASANTFAAGDVGATLVLRGSRIEGNRRNRKIAGFTDAKHVAMDYPAGSNEVITMAGAGIDATWLLVYNHGLPPGGGRELTYIQECRESDGEFLDGTDGFVYEVD
jgi:hypothetical protein